MAFSSRHATSRTVTRAALVLTLGALLVSQTGCKWLARKATEKALEESTGAKNVDLGTSSGSIDIQDGKGSRVVTGQGVKLPSDWPSYLPTYPDAKLQTAITNPERREYTASMMTPDDADKVMAFYKSQLTGSGFKSAGTANLGAFRTDTYKHTDGRQVVVTIIGSDPKNTMVTVNGTNRK